MPDVARRVRVLVVDDHPLFREGVASLLASAQDLELVGEAESGEEALQKVGDLGPDVVLLDLSMPGIGGLKTLQVLARRSPRAAVVVVTMREDPEAVLAAVAAGAAGYVVKGAERGALLRAVRAAAAGEALFDRAVADRVRAAVARAAAPAAAPPEPDGALARLTAREREVLDLMAIGMRNAEIAHRLCVSERTVGNHISSIFHKLQVTDRIQAALRVRRDPSWIEPRP